MKKLIIGVRNNHPTIFAGWTSLGGAGTRRLLREGFGIAGNEMRREGYGAAEIGPEQRLMLRQFGGKLGRALYYKHIGRRLEGRVFVELITFINNSEYLESALQFAPYSPEIKRQNTDLGAQFFYRYNYLESQGIFYAVVQLGQQQGYRIFAFSNEGWSTLTEHNSDDASAFESRGLEALPL